MIEIARSEKEERKKARKTQYVFKEHTNNKSWRLFVDE